MKRLHTGFGFAAIAQLTIEKTHIASDGNQRVGNYDFVGSCVY